MRRRTPSAQQTGSGVLPISPDRSASLI
jgi:hypothetical protein